MSLRKASVRSVPPGELNGILTDLKRAIEFFDSSYLSREEMIRAKIIAQSGGAIVPGDAIGNSPGEVAEIVYTTPPAPTNVAVTSVFSVIMVEFDPALYPGHAYAEILRSGTSALGDAVVVGQTAQGPYVDRVGTGSPDYWYWVRFVNGANPPQTGPVNSQIGTQGKTTVDPEYVLGLLTGKITSSQLAESLSTPIGQIEGIISGLAQEVIDRAQGDAAEALDRANALAQEQADRAAAIAQEQADRAAQILAETGQRQAEILAESNSRVSQISALDAAIRADLETADQAVVTLLQSQVASGDAATLASAQNYSYSKAQTDSAIAAQGSLLQAAFTAADAVALASAQNFTYSRAAIDSADAATLATLRSEFAAADATTLASAQSYTFSQAQINSAIASSSDTLRAQITGGSSSTSLGSITSGLIHQVNTASVSRDDALAQQLTLLSAGAGEQFDYTNIWYFDANVEGWAPNIATSTTMSAVNGWLRMVASTGTQTGRMFQSPAALAINGAKYPQVKLRVRKVGAPTWVGRLYFTTTTDAAWDTTKSALESEPTYDGNGIGLLTFNMPAGWTGATIAQIRFEASTNITADNYFELDWAAIGRPSPGASSAQLTELQTATAQTDAALASDITTLTGNLTTLTGTVATKAAASALTALETRVTATEGVNTSQGSSITSLNNSLTTLTGTVNTKADASALTALDTRVTAAEGVNTSQGSSITTLQNSVTALGTSKADASAVNALTTRVTAAEGVNTSQGTSITSLNNSVSTINGTLATKADASALTTLANTVTAQGGTIASQGTAITSVQSSVQRGQNLADIDWWNSAGVALPAGWSWNGAASENSFVDGIDHTGKPAVLLRMESGAGGAAINDPDGGFSNGKFVAAVDRTKTYRFVIPVRRDNSIVSTLYLGMAGVCNLNTAVANGNPYFVAQQLHGYGVGEWFLIVGYVFPEGSTGKTNAGSGVFRVSNGERVVTGTNYCWHPTNAASYRAFQFYSQAAGAIAHFGRPMIHIVDGSEPPLESILTAASSLSAAIALKANASALTALDARVTSAEGVNTSQGSAITSLDNSLATLTTTVATKADASALTSLTTRVTAAEGVNTSQGNSITTLNNSLTTLTGTVNSKASAAALSALDSRVTDAEGVNTSQANAITLLQSSVTTINGSLATKADTTALTTTNTNVSNLSGTLTAQAGQITTLQSRIERGASLTPRLEDWKSLAGHNIVTIADGKVGETALRLTNVVSNPHSGVMVPLDRTKTYRVRFWARPSADANGTLYHGLQQFLDAAGTAVGPVNSGLSPYKPANVTRAQHNTQFGGVDQWGEYSYLWTAADWQAGVTHVRSLFLRNYPGGAGTTGHWEIQDYEFKEVTQLEGLTASLQIEATTRATQTGDLYAQYTVKTDVGGLISGYGLASTANNAAPTSAFGVQAGQFFVAPPTVAAAVAPTANLFKGFAWRDTVAGVTKYWTGSAWSTTPQSLPFVVQTTPQVINGFTVAPGIYGEAAFFARLVATRGQIGLLAVDDARIASMSVDKLVAGSIAVGQHIQSTGYVPGSAGWRINGDGTAEFSQVVVRGTIFASQGAIGGWNIGATYLQSTTYVLGTSGTRFNSDGTGQIGGITIYSQGLGAGSTAYDTGAGAWIGRDGRFSLRNAGGTQYLRWSGTALQISGELQAATGTFSGALSAASGTFSGSLTADAVNAVNSINIAGNAVTVPSSSFTAGNMVASTAELDAQTLSHPSSGSPTIVMGSFRELGDGNGDGRVFVVRVRRNGVQVFTTTIGPLPASTGHQHSFFFLDSPSSGMAVYTLTIQRQSAGGASTISNRGLTVLEAKR